MPHLDATQVALTNAVPPLLCHALHAAAEHRAITPLRAQGKAPLKTGWNSKDPTHVDRASSSFLSIRRWWRENPDANIGSVLADDEFVLERERGFSDDGWQQFWKDAPGGLPKTLQHRTASGSPHVFLRFPPGSSVLPAYAERAVRDYEGVRYLGSGRMVVWSGSRVNGSRYTTTVPGPVAVASFELIEWLRALLPAPSENGRWAESVSVPAERRWTEQQACPVCGGWPSLPVGQGIRCHGYLSADGRYARCSREEFAPRGAETQPGPDQLFPHRLDGICDCGLEHLAPIVVSKNGRKPRIITLSPRDSEFPSHLLPLEARELVDTIAGGTSGGGLPRSFLGAGAIAALAAAAGGEWQLHAGTWTEPLVLWFALIGDPGSGKSPSIKLTTEALDGIQAAWLKQYQRRKEEWQKLPPEQRRSAAAPELRRLVTTDATIESLRRVLMPNPRGVLWSADELRGAIKGLGQYKNTEGGDRGQWLSLWSARPLIIDRASLDEPVIVPRPIIQVLGGIQPAKLSVLDNDDGLRDRFLFAEGRVDTVPRRVTADREQGHWRRLLLRLVGTPGHQLGLTPEGEQKMTALVTRLFNAQRDLHEPPHCRTWLTKAGSHCLRLGLMLAAVENADIIDASHLERAEGLLNWFWAQLRDLPFHDPNLLIPVQQRDQDIAVDKLVSWLRGRPQRTATRREVQMACVAGARSRADVNTLIARFSNTYPGHVINAPDRRGGPTRMILTAPNGGAQ